MIMPACIKLLIGLSIFYLSKCRIRCRGYYFLGGAFRLLGRLFRSVGHYIKIDGSHRSSTFCPRLQYSRALHLLFGLSKQLKPRQSSQLCQFFKSQPVKFIAGDMETEAKQLQLVA